MPAKEIRELVRRKQQAGLSSIHLKLSKSTVHDMIKNDYEKPKKAEGLKKNIWIEAKESQNNSIKNQERCHPAVSILTVR